MADDTQRWVPSRTLYFPDPIVEGQADCLLALFDDDETPQTFKMRALEVRDAGANILIIVALDYPESLRHVMERFAKEAMPDLS